MSSRHEILLPPSIRLSGDGILLREWADSDLPAPAGLHDDPQTDRWTPLPSPFDSRAAAEYLAKAREVRGEGRRKAQLAITTDGGQPLGEVLLYPSELDARDVELAYGVGSRHRRRGLASRAVGLMADHACHRLAVRRVLLRIEAENLPSVGVARAAGFQLTDDDPLTREAKGRRVTLLTWCRQNDGAHRPVVSG